PVGFQERHRQVGGRPAEHVGQHDDAGVVVDRAIRLLTQPLDRVSDLLPRQIDVVVPADRHRGELRQIADDHFRRVEQLRRELSVRDDDYTDAHTLYLVVLKVLTVLKARTLSTFSTAPLALPAP